MSLRERTRPGLRIIEPCLSRGLPARLRGDRVEAARLYLSPGPLASLAESQKSESASSEA